MRYLKNLTIYLSVFLNSAHQSHPSPLFPIFYLSVATKRGHRMIVC